MTVTAHIDETPGLGWRWCTKDDGQPLESGVAYHLTAEAAETEAVRALGDDWPGTPSASFAFAADTESAGWHIVDEEGEPSFENDWTNWPGLTRLAFKVTKPGELHIFGVVAGGESDEPVFTLPPDCRPALDVVGIAMAVGSSYASALVAVLAAGAVAVSFTSASLIVFDTRVSLDPPPAA